MHLFQKVRHLPLPVPVGVLEPVPSKIVKAAFWKYYINFFSFALRQTWWSTWRGCETSTSSTRLSWPATPTRWPPPTRRHPGLTRRTGQNMSFKVFIETSKSQENSEIFYTVLGYLPVLTLLANNDSYSYNLEVALTLTSFCGSERFFSLKSRSPPSNLVCALSFLYLTLFRYRT